MGFRFQKRIRLPGGFRINLSKSGIGVSAGVPGLRVGVGPRGPQLTASLPGTGLSYTTALGGAGRRPQSAARAEKRRLAAEGESRVEADRAAHEVAVFENQLRMLTSLHREAWSPWDWSIVASSPAPVPPVAGREREAAAISARDAYAPGPLDHLLGREASQRAELDAAVAEARRADEAAHQAALAAHAADLERWRWFHEVALGVLAGDVEACRAVLRHLGPFDELDEVGSSLEVALDRSWCVEASFAAKGPDVVPTEALELTPRGQLRRKKIPARTYWELYQDHVASAAFRIAREVFALLPIPAVLVHASRPIVDPATGRDAQATILSVLFDRAAFEALDLDRIDPSEAIGGFPHRMELRKTRGFRPVEPLIPEELAEPEP